MLIKFKDQVLVFQVFLYQYYNHQSLQIMIKSMILQIKKIFQKDEPFKKYNKNYVFVEYIHLMVELFQKLLQNKCFAILSSIKLSNLDHLKTQIIFFSKIIKNIFKNLF
jgi:hypothetical protein